MRAVPRCTHVCEEAACTHGSHTFMHASLSTHQSQNSLHGAWSQIKQFTLAIESDPTNHVLFSNRSGAHAAKKGFTEALIDANECIKLKGDWAKGYSRRGAAYYGLRNWIKAQECYEKGLELDASSQVMKDELEKVKLMRNPVARAEAERAAGGGAAGFTPASGAAASTGRLAKAVSLGALCCGAVYAVPILGPRRAFYAYSAAVAQILALFLINLWGKFPKTMATLSSPAFKNTQEVQAFVLVIFMLLSPPMPFALMPFLATCLLNVVHGYRDILAKLPAFAKDRLEFLTTAEGSMQVNAFGAVSEVIVTFMGPPLVLIQGYRALMLSFFYFQYVCRRYKTNEQTVHVVGLFVQKADGICKHRFVPAAVHPLYDKVKGLIRMAANRFGS